MKPDLLPTIRGWCWSAVGLAFLLTAAIAQATPTESLPHTLSNSRSTDYLWKIHQDDTFQNEWLLGLESAELKVTKTTPEISPLLPQPLQTPAPKLNQSRSLPAAPASIFMALMGFMCVSLVRDRRFWVVLLTGLMGYGLAGINVVPRLAGRLSQRNQNIETNPELSLSTHQVHVYRHRCVIEGTRYIGLWHQLAGSNENHHALTNLFNDTVIHLGNSHPTISLLDLPFSFDLTDTPSSAILYALPDSNNVLSLTKIKNRSLVYFTPAFIVNLLPRGPPLKV